MPRRNLFALAAVAALSLPCHQASQGARPKDETMELYGLFVDAVEQVQANYVRPVSRKELLESALKGMLQDLDPHSVYINNANLKGFKRRIEGRFGGLGITVGYDTDANRLKVLAPMVGTPAYNAGVLAGDLIIDIEGKSTEGMTPDKAVDVLQGAPGTPVKLNVLHEGMRKPEIITVNRAIIDVPTVLGDLRKPDDRPDFLLDRGKKIGYIRISEFLQNTANDVKSALDDLKASGARGLILDLRGDPGGLLSAAVEVADLFLDNGLIVSTRGRNFNAERTYEAEPGGAFGDGPMVVLIDENSASAAEIVAAALQDHKRAQVVGHRSYGKGSVQNIVNLEDGNSVLKLTVATYFRPSGKNIHRFKDAKPTDEWGVSPDPGLAVELSPADHYAWAVARRERDLLGGKASAALREAEAKAAEAKPDAPQAKPGPKAFKDKTLDKALEVLRAKVG